MNVSRTITISGKTLDLDVSKRVEYRNPIWIIEILDASRTQVVVARCCGEQDEVEKVARNWTEKLLRLNQGTLLSWTMRQAIS